MTNDRTTASLPMYRGRGHGAVLGHGPCVGEGYGGRPRRPDGVGAAARPGQHCAGHSSLGASRSTFGGPSALPEPVVGGFHGERVYEVGEGAGGLRDSKVRRRINARNMPSSTSGRAAPEEMLISLFEDLIYALDVFSVVPVRFHLAETEDGAITGYVEVVPADEVEVVGPVLRLSWLRPLGVVKG